MCPGVESEPAATPRRWRTSWAFHSGRSLAGLGESSTQPGRRYWVVALSRRLTGSCSIRLGLSGGITVRTSMSSG